MKKKILLVFCILFGLMFISSGLNKFLDFMPIPEDAPESILNVIGALKGIGWIMPLVGFVEIVGGVLIMVPKLRAFAAILIFPVMVGIVLLHIVNAPSGLPVALVLFAINLWVLVESREKYLPMVR